MRHHRRQAHPARHVAPVVLGVVLLLLGGCDAFTPRKPPPPCDPDTDPNCRVCPFNEPLQPSVVRDNLIVAMECFLVQPNYADCLSFAGLDPEGFVYVPDPALASLFPGFFDGWDAPREVQFMLNLLESGSERPTKVEFNVTRFVDDGTFPPGDKARYDVEYDLTLTYVDSSQDPPVETIRTYCATALWDFIGGNKNFWKLQRWEEISPSSDCDGSMGLLRATTGQGI
jgi:hypothetical protein